MSQRENIMCTVAGFIVSALLFPAVTGYALEPANEKRLDEVAERGTHVMPFDLEKTLHIFTKTDDGGVQQVIVKDKTDTEQIQLIRKHLSEIAEEFSQINFSKPEHIHDESMPGLSVLKTANPDQIRIEYHELPDGAQITYSTQSPELIQAIHQWFDAQLSDHARHAVSGHQQHHMHHK